MATITAAQVKELRDRTGAGMMDCKRALTENNGDIEEAAIWLQKKGIASAAKKAGRTAAEGLVAIHLADDNSAAVLLEVNCETDFVARNEAFQAFVTEAAAIAFASGATDIEGLQAASRANGTPVETWTKEVVANIGENIQMRRLVRVGGAGSVVGDYIHAGSQIGVVVEVAGDASSEAAYEFARNIAMHVAATNPTVVRPEDLDPAKVDLQREIETAKAIESGKPADIAAKMVEGRIRKWQAEVSLVKQAYVKEPDMTVEQYQKSVGALSIKGFTRFQVGEGIEKAESNLAAEVAATLGQ